MVAIDLDLFEIIHGHGRDIPILSPALAMVSE